MSSIKVSVVIPVYNVEKYLHECMDSVINQTLKEIEIICVDDGSTDSSLSILHEYANKDSRITILTQENQGAGVARNAGLDIATGEYIHFMDSDDYLELNAYEIMYTKSKKHNLDMVKTKVYAIDDQTGGYVGKKPLYSLSDVDINRFNKVISLKKDHEVLTRVSVVPWNGIYRRKFLIEKGIKFNNLICVNDRSFYSNVIINLKKAMVLSEYTINHRINVEGPLVDRLTENFDCCLKSYRIIEEQCKVLTEEYRIIMIMREVDFVCSQFNKYKLDNIYGKDIKCKTKKFLLNIGLDFLYQNSKEDDWCLRVIKSIFEVQVSVIVPVYNAEEYLTDCLDSLINQTLYGIEIICVDDGSTDDSVQIIKSYIKKDDRIILLQQDNKGGGIARNSALKIVKGRYITFLDSDDIMINNALCNMLVTAEENENSDIVISKAFTFSNDLNKKKILSYCLSKNHLPIGENFSINNYSHYLFQVSSGIVWSKMFRNDFIRSNGFVFLPSMRFHDFFFTYWAFVMADKIAILNKATVLYRSVVGSNSLQQTKEETPLTSFENQRILWNKFVEVGRSDLVKQSYMNRIMYRNFQVLSSSQTIETFEIRYEAFKRDIKFYNVDLEDRSYFYEKDRYLKAYRVVNSLTIIEYLFNEYYLFYNNLNQTVKTPIEQDSYDNNILKLKEEIKLLKGEVNKYKGQVEFHVNDKETIKKSYNYRIGEFILALPKKFLRIFTK